MFTILTGTAVPRTIQNVSPALMGSSSTGMINGSQTYAQISTVTAVTSLSTVTSLTSLTTVGVLSTTTSTGFSISSSVGGVLDEGISVQVSGSLSTITYATNVMGTSGSDLIKGGIDVELIEGGKGNDTLYGGGNTSLSASNDEWGFTYSDTFVFQKGDGKDVIADLYNTDMITPNSVRQGQILFKDVKSSEVSVTASGNNITIHYGTNDQVTLFYPLSPFWFVWSGLGQIIFSDGVAWTGSALKNVVTRLC